MPALAFLGVGPRWVPPLPIPVYGLWPLIAMGAGMARAMERRRPDRADKVWTAIEMFRGLRGLSVDVLPGEKLPVRLPRLLTVGGRPTMSRERAKILKMVAEGTITPEDGEKLLGRLENNSTAVAVVEPEAAGPKGPLKYLRVVVDGKDKANVRVPIGLIRTGIKLTTLIPIHASEKLHEHGIDLAEFRNLSGDALTEALRELKVDVETDDGHIIRIFCE